MRELVYRKLDTDYIERTFAKGEERSDFVVVEEMLDSVQPQHIGGFKGFLWRIILPAPYRVVLQHRTYGVGQVGGAKK